MSMLIVWIGAFFLLLLSLEKLQRNLQKLFQSYSEKALAQMPSKDFKTLLKNAVMITTLTASSMKQEVWSLQLFNWRVLPRRSAILLMCLGSLGFWPLLVFGFYYLAVNGLILVGLSFLGYIALQRLPMNRNWQIIKRANFTLFWLGLFYFSAEIVLRYQSILQTFLGTSELTFFLLDRRLWVLLVLVGVGAMKSWFLPFSGWSVLANLALVPTGVISFAGGMSLILGELLFRSFNLYWTFRSVNQECRQIALQGALVSAAGSVAGWVLVQFLIPSVGWGGFSSGDITQGIFNLLMALATLLFVRFVFMMSWGHFVSPRSSEELQEPLFVNLGVFPYYELGAFQQWGYQHLQKRVSEINYHFQGLKQNPVDKIPQNLVSRLENEKTSLERVLANLEENK